MDRAADVVDREAADGDGHYGIFIDAESDRHERRHLIGCRCEIAQIDTCSAARNEDQSCNAAIAKTGKRGGEFDDMAAADTEIHVDRIPG